MSIQCDCSVDDGDYEEVRCSTVTIRKARKQHECCECQQPIVPGKKYEETTVIDHDGYPDRFRTCLPCAAIRAHYCPHGWIWGCLAETIKPCIGFDYRLPASEIPDDPADEVAL